MRSRCCPSSSVCGLCLFLSLSCTYQEQPQGLRVGSNTNKRDAARPVFAEPIVLRRSAYLLIPFWMQTPQRQDKFDVFSGSAGFGSGSGSYSSSGESVSISLGKAFADYLGTRSVRWNNLIFLDKKTGAARLLLDHKAVICRAYFPDGEEKGPAGTAAQHPLLFGVAEQDTNGDGYINDGDAVLLYAASPDGAGGLTRLTPEGTQLGDIVADADDADTIYVRVLRDSNGDRRFTEDDEAIFLRIDLRHPAEGKPLLDEEVRKRAQGIIEAK